MEDLKQSKIKFNYSYVYKLTNKEFETLVYRMITRLDVVEFNDDQIVELISNAKRHLPILTELGHDLKAHPLTEEINRLSNECRDELISLKLGIDSFKRGGSQNKRNASKILNQWIKQEREDLGKRARARQVASVNRLKSGAAKSESVNDALSLLELTERFETATTLCQRIEQLSLIRDRDRNEIRKMREQRRTMCYEDLVVITTILSNRANRNYNEEGVTENSFYDICLDIKSLLDSTHAILKSRNTRYVNEKASLEDEPDQNVGGESSPDSDTTEVA